MGVFRKGPPPHQAAIAMIGAKPGDRMLIAGRPDAAVVAELARITGLLGQTLVVTDASTRPSFEKAAAAAGVLVEIVEFSGTRLPSVDGTHDIVALHMELAGMTEPARDALLSDVVTAARPGGRVVVIDGRPRRSIFSARTATLPSDDVLDMLTRAELVAARALGTIDEMTYFEGRKARIVHTPSA